MSRRVRSLMVILLLIPLSYLLVCVILYFQQDRMVFHPTRVTTGGMEEKAEALGFEPWTNATGQRIGWQSADGDLANALLVFSGNGGYALMASYHREYCRRAAGNWKTYLLEYPGYGSRDGVSSEKSFTAAGVEAVDTLAAVPERTIWLMGVSLGSGTATATVRERPEKIAGLMLATPFNSLVATAGYHYPWLPVPLFLTTRFDSEKNLAHYPGPVAFFLSARDTTVPAVLGQKLYDGYVGRKRLWIASEGNHDVSHLLEAKWPEIVQWLKSESTGADAIGKNR